MPLEARTAATASRRAARHRRRISRAFVACTAHASWSANARLREVHPPVPQWPDAPAAYLQLSEAYADQAAWRADLDEEHITAHVGRHTFATTLIRGGTVRLYAHPSAADRERALNLLPYDANQARWRHCTYLVATPCTAAGRGTP